MDLEQTTLVNEVGLILNQAAKPVHYYWEAAIIAGGQVYPAYKVMSIDVRRDYANNYADQIMIELYIGGGTYARNIVPYKEDLKVLLVRNPIGEVNNGVRPEEGIFHQTFRGTLLQKDQPATAGDDPLMTADPVVGDLVSMRRIQIQLQDLSLEQIRLITVGTVVGNCKPADPILYFLSQAGKSINVDKENQIRGVTMIPANNQEVQDHIVIPQQTSLLELPDYIQNVCCGVYNAGLGFYLQKQMWYVWPLYDLTRFDTYQQTVTVIVVPKNRLNSVERTYRTTANQVIILGTGGARHVDATEDAIANQGNGVRFADSRKMLESFAEVKGNKAVAKRSYNNSEFVGINRASGLNNIPNGGFNNNIYYETSQLASRKGSIIEVIWQNSEPDLITPDKPFQVIVAKDGLPQIMRATVLGTHTYIDGGDNGIKNNRHMSKTSIWLFVDKDLPELKEFEATTKVDQYSSPLPI